jgi:conflict system pore-forming effector with SLATT domain
MFSLKIIDHVRLDSERVAQNYTVHAGAADRIVRLITGCRVVMVALLALAVSAEIGNVMFPHSVSPAVAIAAGLTGLVAFAIYGALGLESRLFAHRAFAHRLWLVAERYRALLSEVNDDLVDAAALVRRRDELLADVDAIYQFAFGVDQAAYDKMRLPSIPDERAA